MKKVISLLFVLALAASLVACGSKKAAAPLPETTAAEAGIYTMTAADKSVTIVDKDGNVLDGYSVDKDGNIANDKGEIVLAAANVVAYTPAETTDTPTEDANTPTTDADTNSAAPPDSSSSSGSSGGSSTSGSSGSSGGSSAPAPAPTPTPTPAPTPAPTPTHEHTWQAVYRTVDDYETQGRAICNFCGADITDNISAHMKNHTLNKENASYHVDDVKVKVGSHEELDHYVCTGCGETQ